MDNLNERRFKYRTRFNKESLVERLLQAEAALYESETIRMYQAKLIQEAKDRGAIVYVDESLPKNTVAIPFEVAENRERQAHIDGIHKGLEMAQRSIEKIVPDSIGRLRSYTNRITGIIEYIARIDEVAQNRKAHMNPDAFVERLKILRKGLTDCTTEYQNEADEIIAIIPGLVEDEVNNWKATVSTIQDEISNVIQGTSDGEALRGFYQNHSVNILFSEKLIDLLSRKRNMEPHRKYVGQQAYILKQENPDKYGGKGGMQAAGLNIIHRLTVMTKLASPEFQTVAEWLIEPFGGQIDKHNKISLPDGWKELDEYSEARAKLGRLVSAARNDYEKRYHTGIS